MAQQLISVDHVTADFLGPLHLAAAGVEGGLLPRFGVELVQLGHGVAQELFLSGDGLAFGGSGGGGFAGGAEGVPRLAHLGNRSGISGVVV